MDEKAMLYLEDAAQQCFWTGKDSELFLDVATGDLWKVSDHPKYRNPDMSLDEALDLEQKHQLIRLPKARDLHELDIMDEYTDFVPEAVLRDLLTILRQPSPFQNYRNRLDRAGLLEDYYQYRNERGADILEEWCRDQEIPCRHQISLRDLSNEFDVKLLSDRQAGQILKLMRSNPKFFRFEPPTPSLRSVKTDLVRVPPHTLLDQKLYLGYFQGDQLVAILDLILDYPKEMQAWIGLLMVAHNQQKQGLGRQIVQDLEGALARARFAHIELAVRPNNEPALKFWAANGYQTINRRKDLLILAKDQNLPEEEYEPEFDEEPGSWTF